METLEKTNTYKFITPWPKINRDNKKRHHVEEWMREVDAIPCDFASRQWYAYIKEHYTTLPKLLTPYQKDEKFKMWTDYTRIGTNIRELLKFFERANLMDKTPDQFDPEAWQEYVQYSVEIGTRMNTLLITQKALKCYFSWLFKHDYCATDYSKFIYCDHTQFSFKQIKKKNARAVTPEIFNRMISAIPESAPHYKLLVTMAYHTGLRMQDLALMTSENVDWDKAKVTVLARKNGEYHESKVPREVLSFMRETMDKKTGIINPLIFKSYQTYESKEISGRIRGYFDKAQCYGYSLHDFRRTKVMQGQAQGLTAEELATSLGHKRVSTTLAYYVPMDLESQTFIEFNQAARQLQAIDTELKNYGHRRPSNAGLGGLGAYHESVSITSPPIPDDGFREYQGIQGADPKPETSNIIRLRPNPRT